MKVMRRLPHMVLLVIPVAGLCASSSGETKVTMLVTTAKQDNSPVQIVGFKLPAQVAGFPIIVVHNTTSKEIRLFHFGSALGNPRGVEGAEPKWAFGLGMPAAPLERWVAADGNAEFPEQFLRTHQAGTWAHRLLSNCLHVSVWVADVKFADGTLWEQKGDSETVQAFWNDSIRPESMQGCDDSLTTREVLSRSDGGSWLHPPGTPNSKASGEILPFYMLICPVSEQVTRCPM